MAPTFTFDPVEALNATAWAALDCFDTNEYGAVRIARIAVDPYASRADLLRALVAATPATDLSGKPLQWIDTGHHGRTAPERPVSADGRVAAVAYYPGGIHQDVYLNMTCSSALTTRRIDPRAVVDRDWSLDPKHAELAPTRIDVSVLNLPLDVVVARLIARLYITREPSAHPALSVIPDDPRFYAELEGKPGAALDILNDVIKHAWNYLHP